MDFSFYLQQGISHIADIEAYDHMVFVLVLCAAYSLKEWRKVLVLLTAFTVGHCITLILAGLGVLRLPQDLIETLIPITILISALSNLFSSSKAKYDKLRYYVTAIFGLVHGAGFSNFYKIMFADVDERIVLPLLGFNLGIELGQIAIVLVYTLVAFVLQSVIKLKHEHLLRIVSIGGAVIALKMIFF